MTSPDTVWHDLQPRLLRLQKLADLIRTDDAGPQAAVLADQIEQQLQTYRDLYATLEDVRRHRLAVHAEVGRVIARSRAGLFFAKYMLRDHPHSADDLREESRLCQEEARTCDDGREQRGFASHAFDLAQLAEAVERVPISKNAITPAGLV